MYIAIINYATILGDPDKMYDTSQANDALAREL